MVAIKRAIEPYERKKAEDIVKAAEQEPETNNCKPSINSRIFFLSLSKFRQEPEIIIIGGFSENFFNDIYRELGYKNKSRRFYDSIYLLNLI